MYLKGTKMDPLGTYMYLLKRNLPSDSFCTFISESVLFIIYSESHIFGGTIFLIKLFFT